MKKLSAAVAKKLMRDLGAAMDKGQAKLLIDTQSKLSAASPVKTGRLASSWMIGHNNIDPSVAAERQKGTTRVEIEPYTEPITYTGTWHISNNLPYAQRAAKDPGYVGNAGGNTAGDWFTSIENNLDRDSKRIFEHFLNQVK